MAAAGKLRSPRGQRDIYLHTRTNPSYNAPKKIDYLYGDDADKDADTDKVGVPQATLDAYNNNPFKRRNQAGVDTVMSYNPITETYDIKPGKYVL